jgi:hypothetical protein
MPITGTDSIAVSCSGVARVQRRKNMTADSAAAHHRFAAIHRRANALETEA